MSPSEKIAATSSQTFSALDKSGRKFLLRRLTALDTLRLFKAAGPVLALNESWLAMASLATSVQEIDGIPVPIPTNEAQIETLVERLGEDGLAAIAGASNHNEDSAGSIAHVGNLPGTPS